MELVIDPRDRPVGNGVVRRVLPWRQRRMVGPFIFADLMGPEDLAPGTSTDIAAHPHIGLSTLTYLLAGRLVHRDSTGAVQVIEPGAVNWMTAGAGVTHSERSHPDDIGLDRDHHGLQTWVALPAELEDGEPFFHHCDATALPEVCRGPVALRLIAGTAWGLASPVPVSSPLVLAELRLGGDGAATVPIDDTHRERGVLAVDGGLTLAGRSLTSGQLAVIEPGSRPVLAGHGRAMLLGGEPVGPRQIWWNFVHSDPDRLEQARRDWAAQQFPKVVGDHDEWVPAPAS